MQNAVCRMLDQGYSENDVYDRIMAHSGAAGVGPTRADASMFIGLAEGFYCPQYANR